MTSPRLIVKINSVPIGALLNTSTEIYIIIRELTKNIGLAISPELNLIIKGIIGHRERIIRVYEDAKLRISSVSSF